MDLRIWISSCLLLTQCIHTALCAREFLQDFHMDATHGGAFVSADATVLDKDGDNIKPTVEEISRHILVRVDTMPNFANPNAPSLKEDNYVFLPFIANSAGNEMVRLEFTYTHSAPCPTYTHSAPVQCMNNITLVLVNTTRTAVVSSIDITASSIHTMILGDGADKTKDVYIPIPAGTAGYRLVVHDEGSSYLIKDLVVSRYFCNYITDPYKLPITCPDSPASNLKNYTVQCTCDDANSSPSDGRPSIAEKCAYNSATANAGFVRVAQSINATCECVPGYTYTVTPVNGPRFCKKDTTTPTPVTTTIAPAVVTTSTPAATVGPSTPPPNPVSVGSQSTPSGPQSTPSGPQPTAITDKGSTDCSSCALSSCTLLIVSIIAALL